MSIIIDPKWTFKDVLQVAWETYPGVGRQLSAPSRVHCLERWANVVGRERAVLELDQVLGEYPNLTEASKAFGMSVSTLSKIKKNFKAMPSVTPFSSEPTKIAEQIKLPTEVEINIETTDEALKEFLELAKKVGINSIFKLMEVFVHEHVGKINYESTLIQFLEISQTAGIDVTYRLMNWITNSVNFEDVITVLENLDFEDLQKLNVAVELSNLKSLLSIWQANTENDNEEFWQQTLLQNSFIFAQLFSFPVILIHDKAYLGGKSISNKGGNIIDFLCANKLTKNTALIEIKTPKTKLLGSQYRSEVYNISNELSGSVIQIANYKNSLLQNYIALTNSR